MKKKHKKAIRFISWILFIMYLIAMVYFLFFSEQLGRTPSDTYHYNLKPFAEINRYLTYYHKIGSFNVILNLLGNVICFMPFGFVIPILSCRQRSIVRITALSFLCSVTIELTQLVTKLGSCDVDDVILNTLGGISGYIIFCICFKIMHFYTDRKKKKK